MINKKYRSRYNPRRFADMRAAEVLDFAQHIASDGYPLTREEHTLMTASIVAAVRWGISRDAEYRARQQWQRRLREEREQYERQRLSEVREQQSPDIVVHL
ncbi:MAG: hypothetical protein IJ767_04350 [Bacteroidaceae bacterium]|nr:hypothetical protein [Bacteroidaceae bacterium]